MAKRGRPRKKQPAEPPIVKVMQDDFGGTAARVLNDPAQEPIEVSEERGVTIPVQEPHPSDREASREARTETRHGSGRRRRKPLGVPEQRLQADVPLGMTGRWVNDTPGRIQRALEADYEFISSDGEVVQNRDGARSEIVGTGRDGGAMKAFLMAIPTVLYKQDQAAKQKPLDATDEAIRRGIPQIDPQKAATPEDRKSFYTPSEGISYRTSDTQ